MLAEVAPLHLRRVVFIPPIFLPLPLSSIGTGVGVGVGEPAFAQYLPPVRKSPLPAPPHTIISLPVHTAERRWRASGALVVLVAVQLSVPKLYLPPVLVKGSPPQTIISLPVHTAV